MVQWHLRSATKPSGGHKGSIRASDKRLSQKGGNPANTKIGKEKKTVSVTTGNNTKTKLLQASTAIIVDASKKPAKAEIIAVMENPANTQFARQNIITKGAKIKILLNGKEAMAKVTSRPGQAGAVHAVLLE